MKFMASIYEAHALPTTRPHTNLQFKLTLQHIRLVERDHSCSTLLSFCPNKNRNELWIMVIWFLMEFSFDGKKFAVEEKVGHLEQEIF